MILSKKELKEYIRCERNLYFPDGSLRAFFVSSKNYSIFKYQKYLRKEEFYGNNLNNFHNKFLYIWYKRKKNILGQRLGFDIPIKCFKAGLHIHHVGPVTINANARIGKNCDISGNVCIGSANGAPSIGDNCMLGYGCIIIGNIEIADNTTIGAGAVVTKSNFNKGAKLAGIPAKSL